MIRYGLSAGVRSVSIAAVSLGLGLVGCGQGPTPQAEGPSAAMEPTANERPQVVVTTGVLCDLTDQIGQDTIALTCLMDPGQDPHTYRPQPSDRQALDQADLVLYDGYNFAPNLIGLIEASANPASAVAVYEVAVPDPLMGEAHDHGDEHGHGDDHGHGDEHGHGDDSHGDEHGEEDDHGHGDEQGDGDLVADPHIWHSATNNGAIAMVIADQLATINPDQSEAYESRATNLVEQFTALDGWIQTQVETIPAGDRTLITTHDAFRYYADAYGLEVGGALSGLSTAEQPSPATLTRLVDQVTDAQVPAIFAESTTNPDLINTVANNAGVEVAEQPLLVAGPGEADSDADTVQAMLVANTCTIVNALGGTCDEASAPLPSPPL